MGILIYLIHNIIAPFNTDIQGLHVVMATVKINKVLYLNLVDRTFFISKTRFNFEEIILFLTKKGFVLVPKFKCKYHIYTNYTEFYIYSNNKYIYSNVNTNLFRVIYDKSWPILFLLKQEIISIYFFKNLLRFLISQQLISNQIVITKLELFNLLLTYRLHFSSITDCKNKIFDILTGCKIDVVQNPMDIFEIIPGFYNRRETLILSQIVCRSLSNNNQRNNLTIDSHALGALYNSNITIQKDIHNHNIAPTYVHVLFYCIALIIIPFNVFLGTLIYLILLKMVLSLFKGTSIAQYYIENYTFPCSTKNAIKVIS
jgi:hypothetical protein